MNLRHAALPAAFLLTVPHAAAFAQSYARSAVDTLRFREVTTAEVTLTTPQGAMPITSVHDAIIGVVLLPGDSAHAWYEALRLELTSPGGTVTPETEGALNQSFTLRVDPRGRVTVLRAPRFPASFEGVTDLTRQFDDFFLRLPEEPLRLGQMWTDTLVRADSGAEKSTHLRAVGSYRVERDTIVEGEPALVITSTQQLRSETSAPVPGQPMRARSILEGADEGLFVYSPRAGRLLGRQRTGSLRGELTMSGADGSMSMAQAYRYTNRVDAIR